MHFLTEFSGPPLSQEISGRWIFDRIEEWAQRAPGRCAFVVDHPDRTEEYRYPEVLDFAERIAAALHTTGIRRGDRVGILMENIPQWVFALLGVLRLGAVAVPLATTLPDSALQTVVEHSGCSLIFSDSPNVEKARIVAAATGATVIDAGGWDPFLASGTTAPPFPQGIVDETALLVYTSGTTGDPKGVQLTTRNLACEIVGVSKPLEITSGHRILSVLPFSHVLPLVANGLGPLCLGATVVFLSSISPQRIIETFKKHRITFFICVPQFFYALHKRIFAQVEALPRLPRLLFRTLFGVAGKIPSARLRRLLFGRIHASIGPDLRFFASGGSRFDPRVASDLDRLGYITLQAYGLTETCAAVTATPARRNVLGTVGPPIAGATIRIHTPDSNGIGEVWISGPMLMKGYYRNNEKTHQVMPDGWLHSGDLGRLRPDGNLVITGRSKDVIILANGENIYPEEIEAHYSQCPFVKEICVLGIADASGGRQSETLHAVIVPDLEEFKRRGQTAIAAGIRFNLENLSKQLPSYQRILSHSIRNEPLPRTVTRKLKRFEIQKDEMGRRGAEIAPISGAGHAIFDDGIGAIVAAIIKEIKPHQGPLDPGMNLELDLGFDSLTRIELLSMAEARIGTRIDEKDAARILTLGELVDTLAAAGSADPRSRGTNWNEILSTIPDDDVQNHETFTSTAGSRLTGYLLVKIVNVALLVFCRLRCDGLEKLPRDLPFLLCPNHQSFLDGPLLVSTLPRRIIDNILILGYADYWKNPIMKKVAKFSNIVSIDPNVNLVRAMQVGAAGLRKNRVLLIFPEGARTIDGHVAPFKKGAAILACELGVPVVPVGLRGAYEMWPRGGRFRLHPVQIAFGDPIDPLRFSDSADPYAALTDALHKAVKQLAQDV